MKPQTKNRDHVIVFTQTYFSGRFAIVIIGSDHSLMGMIPLLLFWFPGDRGGCLNLYGARIPIIKMRLELSGTGFGDVHVKVVSLWTVAS